MLLKRVKYSILTLPQLGLGIIRVCLAWAFVICSGIYGPTIVAMVKLKQLCELIEILALEELQR